MANTIEVPDNKRFDKLVQLSVAATFAEAIRRVDACESIEDIMRSPDNLDVKL